MFSKNQFDFFRELKLALWCFPSWSPVDPGYRGLVLGDSVMIYWPEDLAPAGLFDNHRDKKGEFCDPAGGMIGSSLAVGALLSKFRKWWCPSLPKQGDSGDPSKLCRQLGWMEPLWSHSSLVLLVGEIQRHGNLWRNRLCPVKSSWYLSMGLKILSLPLLRKWLWQSHDSWWNCEDGKYPLDC